MRPSRRTRRRESENGGRRMAEPTLKDVLDAIAKLRAKVDRRGDELEQDITTLKGRPPRSATRPSRRPRAR